MTSAFWTLRIWSRRSEIDVATGNFLVAEIRDAGAVGAWGRGVARLCCGPLSNQRNPLEQSRCRRTAGVPRLYRPGVQKSELFGAGLRGDQGRRPRHAGSI